jgi:hypothetical protein
LIHCFHALCLLPVKFAVPETLEISELDDAALGIHFGGDDTNAAEHRMFSKPFHQQVHVAHAVQHGNDYRLRSDGGGEIIDRRKECEAFYA